MWVSAKLNLLCDMQHAVHKSHKKHESAHAENRREESMPSGLLPDSINTMLSIFISILISILSISCVQSVIHSVNLKSSAEN